MENNDYLRLASIARDYYSFSDNEYHNWYHATWVADKVKILNKDASDDVLLAAFWHDAVYIPFAAPGINENASAAALEYAGRVNRVDVGNAPILIRQTDINNHLSGHNMDHSSDIALLLDADLYALALPYPEFMEAQTNIILENLGDPNSKESWQKVAVFLNRFLTFRPYIYYTVNGRRLWEDKARANIYQLIKDLS